MDGGFDWKSFSKIGPMKGEGCLKERRRETKEIKRLKNVEAEHTYIHTRCINKSHEHI
jgi:hypothetical protein